MKAKDLATWAVSGGVVAVTYETPSYAHALGSGLRLALSGKLSTSGAAPLWGLVDSYLGYYIDGDTVTNAGYTNSGVAVANEWLEFDFTGQASPTHKIDKFKMYMSGVADGGVFKAQLYINDAWVDASANFTLGASATQEITMTVTSGLTKWRIIGVSGSTATWIYLREIEFSIGGESF